MPGMEKVALDRVRIGGEQSSGALTVRSDVVYSDDETYGQKQVPVDKTDNNKHQKDNQLAGNSSLGVQAYLHAVMPAVIPKGSMEEVVCREVQVDEVRGVNSAYSPVVVS